MLPLIPCPKRLNLFLIDLIFMCANISRQQFFFRSKLKCLPKYLSKQSPLCSLLNKLTYSLSELLLILFLSDIDWLYVAWIQMENHWHDSFILLDFLVIFDFLVLLYFAKPLYVWGSFRSGRDNMIVLTHFSPVNIETSNLICTENQMSGFYMKPDTALKWVKHLNATF